MDREKMKSVYVSDYDMVTSVLENPYLGPFLPQNVAIWFGSASWGVAKRIIFQ